MEYLFFLSKTGPKYVKYLLNTFIQVSIAVQFVYPRQFAYHNVDALKILFTARSNQQVVFLLRDICDRFPEHGADSAETLHREPRRAREVDVSCKRKKNEKGVEASSCNTSWGDIFFPPIGMQNTYTSFVCVRRCQSAKYL